jgi:hypothetical protein
VTEADHEEAKAPRRINVAVTPEAMRAIELGASASAWCRLPGRPGRRCDPLLTKRQAGVFGSGSTLGGQNVSAYSIGASPARHSTLATGAVTTRRALDSTILDEACAGAGDVKPVVDDSSGTTAERSCPPTSG